MPNINISLPQRYAEALETKRLQDESLGVCAKRLLLALLDGEIEPSAPPRATPATPATSPSELLEIKQRLMKLEEAHRRTILDHDDESASGDVSERLDDLALQIATIGESLNRYGPHGEGGQSVLIDRIIELEKTLDPIALSYKNQLPLAALTDKLTELEERVPELEEVVAKMLEREFCGGGSSEQVASREELEELKLKVEARLEDFSKKAEEEWARMTMIVTALRTRLSAIESPATEEPKRRGRPPKSDQKT